MKRAALAVLAAAALAGCGGTAPPEAARVARRAAGCAVMCAVGCAERAVEELADGGQEGRP